MFGRSGFPLTTRHRPEFELLIACARRRIAALVGNDVEPLAVGDVDWQALVGLAERHRVVPQVYFALRREGGVPPDVVGQLRDRHGRIVRDNLRLTAELIRIVRTFREEEIAIVAFKGPTLASAIYGGLEQRQFIDLDLLIRAEDLQRAVERFRRLGFETPGVEIERMRAHQLQKLIADSKSIELIKADVSGPLQVDLHWRLCNDSTFFDTADQRIFEQGDCTPISGELIATIPQQELLHYLAFHGGNHRWMRLSWLFDLAVALNCLPRSEWNDLVTQSQRSQSGRYLMSGLLLLERLNLVDGLANTIDDLTEWRGRLQQVRDRSHRVLSAAEAVPLDSVLADGVWRYRFSGSLRPLVNSVLRFLQPKQRDLVQGGAVRRYWSRWRYISARAIEPLVPRKT